MKLRNNQWFSMVLQVHGSPVLKALSLQSCLFLVTLFRVFFTLFRVFFLSLAYLTVANLAQRGISVHC